MPMILNSMFTYVYYKYGFAHGFLINKVKITEDVACLHTVISARSEERRVGKECRP